MNAVKKLFCTERWFYKTHNQNRQWSSI